jgi:hypothetical protein
MATTHSRHCTLPCQFTIILVLSLGLAACAATNGPAPDLNGPAGADEYSNIPKSSGARGEY